MKFVFPAREMEICVFSGSMSLRSVSQTQHAKLSIAIVIPPVESAQGQCNHISFSHFSDTFLLGVGKNCTHEADSMKDVANLCRVGVRREGESEGVEGKCGGSNMGVRKERGLGRPSV